MHPCTISCAVQQMLPMAKMAMNVGEMRIIWME
jgi:hypothetical protein